MVLSQSIGYSSYKRRPLLSCMRAIGPIWRLVLVPLSSLRMSNPLQLNELYN